MREQLRARPSAPGPHAFGPNPQDSRYGAAESAELRNHPSGIAVAQQVLSTGKSGYPKTREANGDTAVVVDAEANKCEFAHGEACARSGSWRENILWALKNDPDIVAIDDIRLASDMLALVAESGLLAVTASSFDNEDDVSDYLRGVGGLRDADQGRVLCIPA